MSETHSEPVVVPKANPAGIKSIYDLTKPGVKVDDAVVAVALALVLHPPADGTEVVAQVRDAGWLDARKDSGHPVMVCPGRAGAPGIVELCPTR